MHIKLLKEIEKPDGESGEAFDAAKDAAQREGMAEAMRGAMAPGAGATKLGEA